MPKVTSASTFVEKTFGKYTGQYLEVTCPECEHIAVLAIVRAGEMRLRTPGDCQKCGKSLMSAREVAKAIEQEITRQKQVGIVEVVLTDEEKAPAPRAIENLADGLTLVVEEVDRS